MNQADYAVEMIHVSKYFGGVCAVNGADLKVRKGTVHALMGENGAGKSTLMKMLCGIISVNEGTVKINGNEVHIKSLIDAKKYGIAMVPQELSFVGYFSVAENMFLGREPKNGPIVNYKKLFKITDETLEKLKIDLNSKAIAEDLSVSQQQMMVIAKVLSENGEIIILDEPTARLGAQEINDFLDYIRFLKANGKTIILISHKMDEIFAVSDEVTVLRDGCVIGTHKINEITEAELITEMVNRNVETLSITKLSKPGEEIILKAEHIEHLPMVKDVSFELRKGEILGFYGLVGAGRTEAIRSIIGVDKKTNGSVTYKGSTVNFKNIGESMNAGIVLIPEERRQQGLVMNMPICQNTTLTKLKRYSTAGFLNQKKEREDANELKQTLKIACANIDIPASSLSGGNQQKVVLSKFVDMPVDIFIFDEPTRGIDVGAKSEIYSLIERISERGTSVIIISSEIPELQSVCDRIVIMYEGEVTKTLLPDEFMSAETMLKYSIGGQSEYNN